MEKKIKQYTILFVVICLMGIGIIGFYNSNSSLNQENSPQEVQQEQVEQTHEEKQESSTTKVTEQSESTKKPTQSSSQTSTTQKDASKSGSSPSSSQSQSSESNQTSSKDNLTPSSESNQTISTPNQEPSIENIKKVNVSLEIQGIDSLIGNGNVEVEEGQSVYDVLKVYTDHQGIEVKKSGKGSTVYIRGIAGLNEFDHGPQSGWMYKVNGTSPNVGAGSYKVTEGDHIIWYYVYSE